MSRELVETLDERTTSFHVVWDIDFGFSSAWEVINMMFSLTPTRLVFLLATTIAKVSGSVQPLVINPSETWYGNFMVIMQHPH